MSTATLPSPEQIFRRNNVSVSGDPHGRPILFVHGFGCGQEMWRLVTPQFSGDHRVVLYDHVGSGRSDLSAYDRGKYDSLHGYAADLLEVVEALDLRDVICVGHSVSAMIGLLAVTRDHSRFGALVLIGPSPRYMNAAGYMGGFSQMDIESLLDSIDANYLGWSAAMAPIIMANGDRPELTEELTSSFGRADPAITRHFARVTFLSDHRRDLSKVSIPTLILQCHDDVISPQTVGEFVHAGIPGSRMAVLAATGHWPVLSAPGDLSAHIHAFVDD